MYEAEKELIGLWAQPLSLCLACDYGRPAQFPAKTSASHLIELPRISAKEMSISKGSDFAR